MYRVVSLCDILPAHRDIGILWLKHRAEDGWPLKITTLVVGITQIYVFHI